MLHLSRKKREQGTSENAAKNVANMAAMQFGRVDEYKESKEDFESYMERFEQWLLANDIANEKKVSVFLSVIRADTYGLLKNLVTPTKPSEMSYNELKAALLAHYRPQPLVIAERFKFQKRNQKEGESVADYIVALRQLSASCEFGQYLSDALRDRFVSGLTSESMQRKLLSQKDLTFRQACEIASSMELASRNTLEIAGKTKDLQSVNAVNEAKLFQRRGKGKFKGRDDSEKGKYQKREQRPEARRKL